MRRKTRNDSLYPVGRGDTIRVNTSNNITLGIKSGARAKPLPVWLLAQHALRERPPTGPLSVELLSATMISYGATACSVMTKGTEQCHLVHYMLV